MHWRYYFLLRGMKIGFNLLVDSRSDKANVI